MQDSRTNRTIWNLSSGLFQKIVAAGMGFISRLVFVQILGAEYLGLNSLFSSVLSILLLAELGVGTTIEIYLYKPLALKDKDAIKAYMQFYKRVYKLVGLVLLILGAIITPFLPCIINFEQALDVNPYLVFWLFLGNSICSYWFFAYKQTILSADQKLYCINNFSTAFSIISGFSKCIVLLVTHDYICSLLAEIIFTIVKNFYIAKVADKLYPEILEKSVPKLGKKTVTKLFKNVYGAFVYKVGDTLFYATDSLIISSILGTIYVGYYDNYQTLQNYIVVAIAALIYSAAASIGNYLVQEPLKKQIEMFHQIKFLNWWASGFSFVCLWNLLSPFIELVFGTQYVLSDWAVLFLTLNFYISTVSNTSDMFKTALGLLRPGRYLNLLGGLMNVLFSIALVQNYGLDGILAATIIIRIVVVYIAKPYYVFRLGFKIDMKPELLQMIKENVAIVIAMGAVWLSGVWIGQNTWYTFAFRMSSCAVIPNVVFATVAWKTKEFHSLKKRIKNLFGNLKKIKREK